MILSRLLTRLLCWLATNAPRRRPITARCTAVGLLPLPREEFRQLKLILHSELRRRAASRRALPCPSSSFFLSPRDLRGPSADRRETWPHDRKLSEFYNPSPKIRGARPQKNLGPKICKTSVDFIQPPTLITNISGTAQDIQNLKTN